jgi:hypothetical protein
LLTFVKIWLPDDLQNNIFYFLEATSCCTLYLSLLKGSKKRMPLPSGLKKNGEPDEHSVFVLFSAT